jgi:GNAT superfamily N-acetyltransferase
MDPHAERPAAPGDEQAPTRVQSIRDAVLEELPALEELQRRASMVWEEYRAQLAAHPDAIVIPPADIEEHRTRVAWGTGQRLGFSVVLPIRDGVCELDGLFVEPGCWRLGVGRALIEDVVANAIRTRAASLEVTANPRALTFYEALGFQGRASVPTRFGSGLRMHRTLQPRPSPEN